VFDIRYHSQQLSQVQSILGLRNLLTNILSKVFFVVTCSGITSCWFTSMVWLCSTSWVAVVLLGNPTQLFYSGSSLVVVGSFSIPPHCNYFIILINESHRCYSCCQSSAPLTLTSSLSFSTCCFGYWLQVVITATTLISTLSGLSSLNVVVAFELIGLVLNMFCTSIFLGRSPYLCSTL